MRQLLKRPVGDGQFRGNCGTPPVEPAIASEDNVIEIRDLYKYYGERRALGALSFEVSSGQIVGLLGLNGAGKTTTLRILACDLLPTSGTVRVGGVDVVNQPEVVRAKIGYLPDSPPLYLEMTVREYLQFAGKIRGMKGSDVAPRVDEVIRLTELASVQNQRIGTLSHGFKQRVGIAQSIVHRPELVVLDEPISGLDPVQIVEMRQLVRSLAGEHTVILSSHILSEISETCDRILVIGDGKIIADGTEAELSARWLTSMRVEVVARYPSGTQLTQFWQTIRELDGVIEATPREPREQGENLLTFDLSLSKDVREALIAFLVGKGFGILQLTRSHRDLENVFLQLSEPGKSQAQISHDEAREVQP